MPYMGIGDGMAVLGPCLVAATGILKWRKNGSITERFCDDRSGNIKEGIGRLEKGQLEIFNEIREIRREMK